MHSRSWEKCELFIHFQIVCHGLAGRSHLLERRPGLLPTMRDEDAALLAVSNATAADLASMTLSSAGGISVVAPLFANVVADRLALAGEHMVAGGQLLLDEQFRSSISRHYYGMYHAARSIVFAVTKGDDFKNHEILARNLPGSLPDVSQLELNLTLARLLRNQADYDPYPTSPGDWATDARALAATAAEFCEACDTFATTNGFL